MPPHPSSTASSAGTSGHAGSTALKASTGSSFNRDLAKSCILGKLPSAKLANASMSGSGSTGHKLLETLTSLRQQADKENAGSKSSAGSTQKIGSARRVPISGKESTTPAVTPTAAATAAATAGAAEKAALTQQLESLRSQLAQLEQTLREKDAANSKLLAETTQLKESHATQAQELRQARSIIEQLQQQNKALQTASASAAEKSQEPTAATSIPSAADAAMFAALSLAADEPTIALPSKQAAASSSDADEDDEEDDDIVFGGATGKDEDDDEEEEVTAALTVARQAAANCDTPIKSAPVAAAVAAPVVTSIVPAADELDQTIPEAVAAPSMASPASPTRVNESSSSINLSTSTASPFNAASQQLPASFLSNPTSPAAFLSPIASRSPPAKEGDEGATTTAIPDVIAYGAPASMLSQSALKIQARFRGHMERSYVSRHEARLAALPLTSPSTPLRGAATPGESPLAKRQRVSASPIASKCAMLLEEEAEEAGLLDGRELSFQTEETEEVAESEESNMGVSSVPIVTAAATAAAPRSRIPSLLNTSASAAASSASSIPLPLSPVSPSNANNTFLTLADQKRFVSELRSLRPTLGTIDACWTLRSKAMNRLECLVRDRGGAGGLAGWSGWAQELTGLQRALGAQLSDLRSSILREACRLLIALSEASPRDFEEQLAFYAPLLWKGLYVTIKIISSTSDETMTELVARVATVKSVPVFLSCLNDPHSVVREKAAAYLLQIVSVCSSSEMEVYLPQLCAAFKSQTQDQDGKVRAAWRALFEGVHRLFPAQMDAFYLELPQPVQKAFEMDRKAKTAAAGKAGAKRKK